MRAPSRLVDVRPPIVVNSVGQPMFRVRQAEIQTKVDDLKSRGRKLTADKEIVVGKISADVLAAYELLAKRQIAVGQVVNRSCSACRMGLTASAIDALSDLAEDELGYCPECQAMIVR